MVRRQSQPQWAEDTSGRVRLLLESPPSETPSLIASMLERHGYSVEVCEGPSDRPCPLVGDGACALAAEADVVVNLLGNTAEEDSVLTTMASRRRPPAVVVATGGRPELEVPRDAVEVAGPLTGAGLLEALSAALTDRGLSAPG